MSSFIVLLNMHVCSSLDYRLYKKQLNNGQDISMDFQMFTINLLLSNWLHTTWLHVFQNRLMIIKFGSIKVLYGHLTCCIKGRSLWFINSHSLWFLWWSVIHLTKLMPNWTHYICLGKSWGPSIILSTLVK